MPSRILPLLALVLAGCTASVESGVDEAPFLEHRDCRAHLPALVACEATAPVPVLPESPLLGWGCDWTDDDGSEWVRLERDWLSDGDYFFEFQVRKGMQLYLTVWKGDERSHYAAEGGGFGVLRIPGDETITALRYFFVDYDIHTNVPALQNATHSVSWAWNATRGQEAPHPAGAEEAGHVLTTPQGAYYFHADTMEDGRATSTGSLAFTDGEHHVEIEAEHRFQGYLHELDSHPYDNVCDPPA